MVRLVRANGAYAAAFFMNISLGSGTMAVTYRAGSMGSGPFGLGLLALLAAAVYVLVGLTLGRLSDTWGRVKCIRAGGVLNAAALGCAAFASHTWELGLALAVSSAAAALFWPALEADIGDHASPDGLAKRIGRFNVAWCSGLALMGVSLGYVGESISQSAVLAAAGGCSLVALFFHLYRRFEPEPPTVSSAGLQPDPNSGRLWLAALALNFAAAGTNAALRYHIPVVTGAQHSTIGGAYLSAMFATEVVVFALLGRWHAWRRRSSPLLISAILVTLGSLACGASQHPLVMALGYAAVGAGCGVIYNASIFCSIAAEHGRGRRGGIHEAVIGLGGGLLPFAGGIAAGIGAGAAPSTAMLFLVPSVVMVAIAAAVAPLLLQGKRTAALEPQG